MLPVSDCHFDVLNLLDQPIGVVKQNLPKASHQRVPLAKRYPFDDTIVQKLQRDAGPSCERFDEQFRA